MQSFPTAPDSVETGSDAALLSSVLPGSVAKPTDTQPSEALVTLQNMADVLSKRKSEANVKKLLADAAILQTWQTTVHPTHEQRDVMMKLGSDWHVPQKLRGKKRKPVHVAEDLEKEFIATAKRYLENKSLFGDRTPADKK